MSAYPSTDPEYRSAYHKAYYQKNKERIKARIYAWREKHPDRVARSQRTTRHKSRYGLERGQFRDMLVAQAGRCLICDRVPEKRLQVDHDHASGRVRGLLCGPCNKVLGHAKDNPEVLRSAAEYVEMSW